MEPVRAVSGSLVGRATIVSEFFVLPVNFGSVVATSTQLMSESQSLSHISTSGSGGDLAGWTIPSAEGVESWGLAEDACIERLGGSSIVGIIGPSLGLASVRLHIKVRYLNNIPFPGSSR